MNTEHSPNNPLSTFINKGAPVLVTGATGYVAGQLIKLLLEQGVRVHAAVRDPSKVSKLKFLNQLADTLPGSITYFKADLLDSGSYLEAMQGCELVYHTASPFSLDIQDPQRDLVDPALKGTQNVLQSANQCPSVKRVVLTSSVAAVMADNTDIADAKGDHFTEADWNERSSLKHGPYLYSKTLAEREAWKIAGSQTQWDLVVINPSLVIGPGINPHATSESFKLIKQMGDGTMRMGAPKYGMGMVDVREVATAHLKAGFDQSASGRHILSAKNTDLFEAASLLKDKYPSYPLPPMPAPKCLLMIVGPWIDKTMTREMIKRNVDVPIKLDNSKSINQLGIHYRPLKTSLEDMFAQLIESGQIKKR